MREASPLCKKTSYREPLIFFSISSSIAGIHDTGRAGKMLILTVGIFAVTAASVLVTRVLYGKDWYKKNLNMGVQPNE